MSLELHNQVLILRALFALGAVCAAPALAAATHEVTVSTSFFTPRDLTIAAGDTVRWTYTPPTGGGNCGPYYPNCDGETQGVPHSIRADDGSFASGAPEVGFVFEHTFTQPGEVRYYCEQHSEPGRDINTSMNGIIRVQATEPAFRITSGLNDAWFNPATPGQGFFVTVFEDIGQMFVAWFTYDVERPPPGSPAELGEPGHRWLTAFGPFADHAAALEVEITSGGVFDAAQPEPEQDVDGTLTLEFASCTAGTVSYAFPALGLEGSVPIQRIADDNLPACEALSAAAAADR